MTLRHVLLAGVVVAGLAISGVGVASALMDLPQDATPAPADPIGDLLDRAQDALTPNGPPGADTPAPTPAPAPLEPTAPPPGQPAPSAQEAPLY